MLNYSFNHRKFFSAQERASTHFAVSAHGQRRDKFPLPVIHCKWTQSLFLQCLRQSFSVSVSEWQTLTNPSVTLYFWAQSHTVTFSLSQSSSSFIPLSASSSSFSSFCRRIQSQSGTPESAGIWIFYSVEFLKSAACKPFLFFFLTIWSLWSAWLLIVRGHGGNKDIGASYEEATQGVLLVHCISLTKHFLW